MTPYTIKHDPVTQYVATVSDSVREIHEVLQKSEGCQTTVEVISAKYLGGISTPGVEPDFHESILDDNRRLCDLLRTNGIDPCPS